MTDGAIRESCPATVPPAWGMGCASMRPVGKDRIPTQTPLEDGNGVATSTSPRESGSDGNEDVAAPIGAGAVPGCAPCRRAG